MPIAILHQDQHLLAVDKPRGVLVVPAPGRKGATVVDQVQAQLGGRVYAVHRLDEDTTGVLLLARTEPARHALEAMLREHAVERVYLAAVTRAPSPAAGRIESRLHERPDGIVVASAHGPGERAVTHYRTLRRLPRGALLECRLETGRRNQIRVHLAELGCPVAGDRKYGDRRGPRGPLLLHSWRLALRHPVTGAPLAVETPPPVDFPMPS